MKKLITSSMKVKLIICITTISIVPIMILGYISYQFYIKNLQENTILYSAEVIARVDKTIETYVSDIINILNFRNDYYLLHYLKLTEAGNIDNNRKYTVRMLEQFNQYKMMKTDLEDIRVVMENGYTIGSMGQYWDTQSDAFFKLMKDKPTDEAIIMAPHQNLLNVNVFTICKGINASSLHQFSALCIDVNTEFLNRIVKDINMGTGGYVYLTDAQGKVIYQPARSDHLRNHKAVIDHKKLEDEESGSFIHAIEKQDYIVTFITSSLTGWRIVGVSLESELVKGVDRIRSITVLVIAICIVAVILISVYITNRMTKPIKALQELASTAAEKNFSDHATVQGRDEIGYLALSFNRMITRIRELMDQIVEDKDRIRKMEIKAMQEMIKPHFVYNTLDSIIGLLESNRIDDALDMIEALGKLFRTSLSHGKEIIAIHEEVDHVLTYIRIQQFRFFNKFDYEANIDSSMRAALTVKLILQPLVENSIYHGIRGKEGRGRIEINGYQKADHIVLEVLDNGGGIEATRLRHINHVLAGRTSVTDASDYFGIRNVNERIKLAFGPEFGLMLEQVPGGGIKAVVRLPLTSDSNGGIHL
ncbi:cache domain-containing sensor histidine kinase [Paenibacillus pinihumi]|uniref:cache domain-containing sensor histidine kinase n=1 Tax=Paenibacillus pinihumi TaxID=669462 RepID=UPI0004116E9B|nr:sensor histidine kinase [Paenibacillus pinihumi]